MSAVRNANSMQSLCFQYKRQWPELWKMGAKNKGIDLHKGALELTPNECIIMVYEVEALIELQKNINST